MTSNHTEAIHSIPFQMVRKTEALGMDTMKLGAALAVIRYNDGFAGVKKVFETLGVNVGVHMFAKFVQLDIIRILRSEGYVAAQQRRFAKRQRRGDKVWKQVKELVKAILLENSLLLNPILILRDQQRSQQ